MKSQFQFFICLLLVTFAKLPASAETQIIYVDQNRGYHYENGKSWATAYSELRTALGMAQPSHFNVVEIWVAKGTYTPQIVGPDPRTSSFVLKSHLRILGGFAGTETSSSERVGTNVTVLSGDIG